MFRFVRVLSTWENVLLFLCSSLFLPLKKSFSCEIWWHLDHPSIANDGFKCAKTATLIFLFTKWWYGLMSWSKVCRLAAIAIYGCCLFWNFISDDGDKNDGENDDDDEDDDDDDDEDDDVLVSISALVCRRCSSQRDMANRLKIIYKPRRRLDQFG